MLVYFPGCVLVCACSKGSDQTVQMRRLSSAFAGCICLTLLIYLLHIGVGRGGPGGKNHKVEG